MIERVFGERPVLVGVVHLLPLPGSAGFRGDMDGVISRAVVEAKLMEAAGYDALIIENTHDAPYQLEHVEPETTAALAAASRAVREAVSIPLGVQALAAANREALGVAVACGLQFVRVENFAFAHVADEGIMIRAAAPDLLRARARLHAENILILADVKKKHASHAITADVSIEDAVHAVKFARGDVAIVTGTATGRETNPEDVVAAAREGLPIFVGSGVTPENMGKYPTARGMIVGSWIKKNGDWREPLDPDRVHALRQAFVHR